MSASSGLPTSPNVAAQLAAFGAWQAAATWLASTMVRNMTDIHRAALVAWFGAAARDGDLLRQVPALTGAAERLVQSQADWAVAWTEARRGLSGERS